MLGSDLFFNIQCKWSAFCPCTTQVFLFNNIVKQEICMSGLEESFLCPSDLSHQVQVFCLLSGHMVFPELTQAHQAAFPPLWNRNHASAVHRHTCHPVTGFTQAEELTGWRVLVRATRFMHFKTLSYSGHVSHSKQLVVVYTTQSPWGSLLKPSESTVMGGRGFLNSSKDRCMGLP